MALEEYRRKRDFAKTSEPKGASKTPKTRKTRSFVIQKHAASHLHYDFRLELAGVLKSWAVPKGPSLDPKVKRLAIEVEDHPLDYASFEGTIPAGEYGGGTVIVWDQGEWWPLDDSEPPEQQLADGELKVMLQGTKLQGGFVLVRTRTVGGKPQWLLIKERDDQARPEADYIVTEAAPDSAASGRSLEQVAAGKPARPRKAAQAGPTAGRANGTRRRTATPGEYLPALATLVEKTPEGEEWIHEIKFDGYRLMGHSNEGEVRLLTRNQLDWTARFPNIAQALGKATSRSFVIDGELVALDEQGISSFKLLQSVLKKGETSELVYYAFDLLELDGEDLRPLPLLDRKARLEKLVAKLRSKLIRTTEHIAHHGPAMFQECCRMGLEGIVSKRAQGRYPTGRSLEWLKTKCIQREEFVIGGFTAAKGERSGFGALLLGQYSPDQQLIYAGRVGAGFTDAVLRDLGRALRGRTQTYSPFANLARRGAGAGVTFVKPELVCQVEFATWTADGLLRHASFLGLREDRPAAEVHHPIAIPPPKAANAEAPRTSMRGSSSASKSRRTATAPTRASEPERPRRAKSQHEPLQIEGVTLTHPERLVYPEQEVTKRQLAEHLALVADWMLPHIAQRPLSLLRCPDGTAGACFYQKHAGESMPDDLGRVLIAEKSRSIEYVYVKTVHDLVSLAQMNVLEIHPWGARIDRLEQPDRLIFDLDPDDAVEWKQIIAAAHEVRAVLSEAGLDSYVKTTGGKGLHVVAPIQRRSKWPEIKRFCKELAQALAAHSPKRYTTNISKAARVGRILIDYLRNDRGSTAVAPYSPRARSSAGVATPLTWEELDDLKAADQWTILSFPQRLSRLKRDPWSAMLKSRQQLRRTLVPG